MVSPKKVGHDDRWTVLELRRCYSSLVGFVLARRRCSGCLVERLLRRYHDGMVTLADT